MITRLPYPRTQAPMFLSLANHTAFGSLLTRPGYMATVLAPDDGSVWDMLKSKGEGLRPSAVPLRDVVTARCSAPRTGYSQQQAQNDPSWLTSVVGMHVLPPTPDIQADHQH